MSSSNVEQIKERLNIVDVISGYIKVEKAGVNFKARCPFHNEKTPSFLISPSRQTYYCFGCGEKGDVFSFVEKFEGLDFKGALQSLADRAGVELKNFKNEAPERREEKDELFEIMEEATKFFEKELGSNKEALKYLEKRGLSQPSIKKWRLGFALDEWRALHDYLIGKKFSKERMLEAGLIKKATQPSPEATAGKAGQAKYYDTFRNRIMFPICDGSGRVIAFSGRAMKENDLPAQAGKTPKYLNSPETKLFYKSEVLYGFHIAKNYIRKMDYAVLVEGQMDLLMSQEANVLNTVASSGTALTEQHLRKIQKLSNRVVIAFDSDLAGEKASTRSAEIALGLGMEAKITTLPEGEDPASVIKSDPEKWKEVLKQSEHFTDFILNQAVKRHEGRNLTREILKNVLPIAHLIKSEIEKTQFIKKIALKMKVREDDVWNDLDKIKNNKEYLGENENNNPNSRDQKEEFIIEAEKFGFKIDTEKIRSEIAKNIEIKELKRKRQEITITLDDKEISKEEKNELEENLKILEKRYKELNN